MPTSPYRTLMRYKRWATNGLNDAVAANQGRLAEPDLVLVRRLLDHVQVVDEIFGDILDGRESGHAAPRSPELPSLDELARRASATADWYVAYADALTPDREDEAIDFRFTSGEAGRMTRGEMLLHVAAHGTYHRGNVGVLLQRNGAELPPDRITDFLAGERSAAAASPSSASRAAL